MAKTKKELNEQVVTINRKDFTDVIKNAVINAKTTNPILTCVLLKARNGVMEVHSSNNLEMFYIGKAQAEGNLEAVVNYEKLNEIINKLPGDEVQLKKTDSGLEIRQGKIYYKLSAISPDEFIKTELPKNVKYIDLDSAVLLDLINKTTYATSEDTSSKILTGILFELDNNLKLIATNGHRLSLAMAEINSGINKLNSFVLPKKGALEIKKIISQQEKIRLGIDKLYGEIDYIIIEAGNKTLIIRTIEGTFPDYSQVIPKENNNVLVIDKKELSNALQRMIITSAERSGIVKMALYGDRVEISSESPDEGEGLEVIQLSGECGYKGNEMVLGINANYVLDMLKSAGGDKIVMEFLDELSAILTYQFGQDKERYLNVIMPVRIPSH